jgi:hypothetical protein
MRELIDNDISEKQYFVNFIHQNCVAKYFVCYHEYEGKGRGEKRGAKKRI